MAKQQIKGAVKQVSGGLKKAVGKVTGDRKTQTKGTAEAAVGKTQGAADQAKRKVKKTLKG